MPQPKLPIAPHESSLAGPIIPAGSRVLDEMVSGALALRQADASLAVRHNIGGIELCEPDYRQILLWANALRVEPVAVIERLLSEPSEEWEKKSMTRFADGRIIKLGWDMRLLPLDVFDFVDGLVIESVTFIVSGELEHSERRLSLPLPCLRELECTCMDFPGLDLSGVPHLTHLSAISNKFSSLHLKAVPLLTKLWCSDNQISTLDLSSVPRLTVLQCATNQLTKLDLSGVSELTGLCCDHNRLTQLDLSCVPRLKTLSCAGNLLSSLDIRPLRELEKLIYDKNTTRLIQRHDQQF